MRRFGVWPASRGRRVWVLAVAVVLLAAAAAFPYARAWYHWRAGRAALDRYRTAEAREHFDGYLRAWPESVPAHLLAGRAARQAGDLEAAQSHIRECQRLLGSSSPETTLEWSLLRASGGDLDEVEYFLQEQVRTGAVPPQVVMEALAEGYLRVYRIRDALACLDAWLAREPDNVRALTLHGDVWRAVQVWAKAVPDYRRAIELDPGREDTRWWLAVSLQEMGRPDEALHHLEVLLPKRSQDVEFEVCLASSYKSLMRIEEARKLLDAVLADHSGHALALRTRGEVEMAAANLTAAEPWLRRAVRAAPNDYRAQYVLAQCLQSQSGREAEARVELRRAEKLKERLARLTDLSQHRMSATPHDPGLHVELGELLLELGEKDGGRRWLLSALRLDPACKAAHAALASFYREQGNAGQADYHAKAALNGAASAASGSSKP